MSLSRWGTFIIFIAIDTKNVHTYRNWVGNPLGPVVFSQAETCSKSCEDWTELIFATDQGINHIFLAVFTVL